MTSEIYSLPARRLLSLKLGGSFSFSLRYVVDEFSKGLKNVEKLAQKWLNAVTSQRVQ